MGGLFSDLLGLGLKTWSKEEDESGADSLMIMCNNNLELQEQLKAWGGRELGWCI